MLKKTNQELARVSIEQYDTIQKIPVNVVLDNVRSLNNVGAIFRTCDAFVIKKLYLCGVTGYPPHRDIYKTALGATETVPWQYVANTAILIQELKEKSYCIAIEQAHHINLLHDFEIKTNVEYTLIFGNEVDGVQQSVMDIAHDCIEIPQSGSKHSLNIAVSVGVVLWEFYRKLKY